MKSVMLYIIIFFWWKSLAKNAIVDKLLQTVTTIPHHSKDHLLTLNFVSLMLNGVIPQMNEQKNAGLSISYSIFINR